MMMHNNSCNHLVKNYLSLFISSFIVFFITTASKLTQTLLLTFLIFSTVLLLRLFFLYIYIFSSFVTRFLAYPTSALDDADAPIHLKVLVANLQDPSISNTRIIIGPYGCAQELGTAAIVGAPEHTQNGHLFTVLLPEGKHFMESTVD